MDQTSHLSTTEQSNTKIHKKSSNLKQVLYIGGPYQKPFEPLSKFSAIMDTDNFNNSMENANSRIGNAADKINDALNKIQSSVENASEVKVLSSHGSSGGNPVKLSMDSSTDSGRRRPKSEHSILGIEVDKTSYGLEEDKPSDRK